MSVNNSESQSNPIPDVAQVLADVLKFPATVIEMTGGDTSIDKALEQVK